MLTQCSYCHEPVDLAERLKDWATLTRLAKWGIVEAIARWGVLCDACYDRQEAVR